MKEFLVKNVNSKIKYHDLQGLGTPILFIHGLGCISSFDYPQVATSKHLQNNRRILIDLLGSGFSDKPSEFSYSIEDHANYLNDFIENLELKEVILYGHSMGGSIAITLASKCVDRISSLIISEANLDSGGGFFSKKIASYFENDYINEGHFQIINESKINSNNNWAIGLENSFPVAINREAKSLVKGQSPTWRELFYSLETKKTFIFGEHSLPDPDLEELKKHNINIEIVKNSDHSMAWENPEGLSEAIRKGIDY